MTTIPPRLERRSPSDRVTAMVTCMSETEIPFIRQALSSVAAQTRATLLCFREDFPVDIRRYLHELAEEHLAAVRTLPMGGPAATRNRGLSWIDSEWTAFCDGDDMWLAGKLPSQVRALETTGAQLCGCDHILIDSGSTTRAFGASKYIPMPSSWVVRTESLKRHPFPENVPVGSDGRWWVETRRSIEKTRLPEHFLLYRVREGSVSGCSHSMIRKKRVVNLASNPFIGQAIRVASWFWWKANRSRTYKWHGNWERPRQLHPNLHLAKP